MRKTIPLKDVEYRISQRPAGYREDLERAIVARDGDHIVVDTEHPCFIALKQKYSPTSEEIEALQKAQEEAERKLYHALWDELHRGTGWTIQRLAAVVSRIPCGDCRMHWNAWAQDNPPPLGDEDAMFAWLVSGHDEVNLRLGKPVFGIEAARVKYNR